MTADDRYLRADLIEEFLLGRGWRRHKEGSRLIQFSAPTELETEGTFLLSLPADDKEDSQIVVRRVAASLASIYGISLARLLDQFSARATILSVQLRDRDTTHGSVTLPRFEAFLERIKKTLTDVASFVITEQPTVREAVADAEGFVKRCRFLQTEHGSYVAKIQLPAEGPLVQPTLFDEDVPQAAAVSERLADVLSFVVGPVFRRDPEIRTDEFFLESRELLNVDVLSDIGELFTKVATEEMNFTFASLSGERVISSGRITEVKEGRLASFVQYVRERVDDVVVLDVVGRIIKLHSRNPLQHRNYVAIAAIHDSRPVTIGVTLRSADYSIAVMAHRQNQLVRLRGRAQRLKTQFSVTELEILEPVGSNPNYPETVV